MTKRSSLFGLAAGAALALCMLMPVDLAAAHPGHTAKEHKTAIVLASFGTTYEQKDDPLAIVGAAMKKRYPGIDVFPAYTSAHVVKTLKEKGKKAESLPVVLARLGEEGYTHVAVQSLHVTPGREFNNISETTRRFSGMPKGLEKTAVGLPLIGSDQGGEALAKVLIDNLPAKRQKNEAVVYVGHGAEDPSGTLAYPALQALLTAHDPLLFVGTIEGSIDVEAVLRSLKARNVKKVWITPLLTIAGDHAQNDIFGDEDDSWKSVFSKAGIECSTVEQGLISLPGIAGLWVENAGAALKELED